MDNQLITLIEKKAHFSNSPPQEVLNFLHNLFASKSLSHFSLYPVLFMSGKPSDNEKGSGEVKHTGITYFRLHVVKAKEIANRGTWIQNAHLQPKLGTLHEVERNETLTRNPY